MPDSAESATLVVTIIPVSPEGGVATPGVQVIWVLAMDVSASKPIKLV